MESEQERLTKMYGGLGDEHLKDLADDRANLSLDGQIVLDREMERRGFAPVRHSHVEAESGAVQAIAPGEELEEGFTPGIPGIFPSTAGQMERALEPGGARRDGMVDLVSFFDGHELTRACEALEAAGIDLALEPEERDALEGAPPSFTVWVEEAARYRAQSVLREKLGLFPLEEAPMEDQGSGTDAAELLPVAEFDTAGEADRVAALLGEQAIFCRVSEEPAAHQGSLFYVVAVRAEDQQRALAVAAAALGVE